MIQHRQSFITLILCTAVLLLSPFLLKKWNNPYNSVIMYDAAGYYIYLPAFFYDDLGKIDIAEDIIREYNPFGCDFYATNQQVNENHIIKYTSGVAILELPAFAAGHLAAKIWNYPTDGFSKPYQIAVNFWGIVFGIAGLWITRKNLLRYFSDTATAFTLLALSLATNLYLYISFGAVVTHTYLFTLYALLISLTIDFYKKPDVAKSIALGLTAGFITLVRPTDIICVLLIFCWNLSNISTFKNRIRFWAIHQKLFILFGISAFLIGSIQLIYWKIYSGNWIFWSYGAHEFFDFLHPHLINGLFSYKKGWLIYTPVMIFSLLGFYPLYRKFGHLFLVVFLFFIINTYIVFSWNEWWYGGSFSQRAMIQSYAVLAFPMTAFFSSVLTRKTWKYLTILLLAFFIWLNLTMTYQCYSKEGIMENYMMSKTYFWKIFGKTHISQKDKKYIELEEEIPQRYTEKMQTIYKDSFDQQRIDSCFSNDVFPDNGVLFINKDCQRTQEITVPISGHAGYYQAMLRVFAPEMEWDTWKQAQIILTLKQNGIVVKSNYYRIYRIIDTGKWEDISIELITPEQTAFNELSIQLWNADGNKTLYADNLNIRFAGKE
ncbi:MAG TPA: hypothetical protein PLW43_00900 [Chitinophagales bacterium]|nr:hypothetical protein [Chitinophagales bacterium]